MRKAKPVSTVGEMTKMTLVQYKQIHVKCYLPAMDGLQKKNPSRRTGGTHSHIRLLAGHNAIPRFRKSKKAACNLVRSLQASQADNLRETLNRSRDGSYDEERISAKRRTQ
jgi:hypothetical protein